MGWYLEHFQAVKLFSIATDELALSGYKPQLEQMTQMKLTHCGLVKPYDNINLR